MMSPEDERGVRSAESVPELHFGAVDRYGCAFEQESDRLATLCMGAAGEFVALAAHPLAHGVDGVVDEGRDGHQRDVEELT